MKKFLASKLGNNIVGITLTVVVFVLLAFVFEIIGGAIGGAIAGLVGFGTAAVLTAVCKEKEEPSGAVEEKDEQ